MLSSFLIGTKKGSLLGQGGQEGRVGWPARGWGCSKGSQTWGRPHKPSQVNARSRQLGVGLPGEQSLDRGPAGTPSSLGGRGLVKSISTLLCTWSGASSA